MAETRIAFHERRSHSSAAAALLKEAGWDLTGFSMQLGIKGAAALGAMKAGQAGAVLSTIFMMPARLQLG